METKVDQPKLAFDTRRNTEQEFLTMCVNRLKGSNEAWILLSSTHDKTINDLEVQRRMVANLEELNIRQKSSYDQNRTEWDAKMKTLTGEANRIIGERDEKYNKLEQKNKVDNEQIAKQMEVLRVGAEQASKELTENERTIVELKTSQSKSLEQKELGKKEYEDLKQKYEDLKRKSESTQDELADEVELWKERANKTSKLLEEKHSQISNGATKTNQITGDNQSTAESGQIRSAQSEEVREGEPQSDLPVETTTLQPPAKESTESASVSENKQISETTTLEPLATESTESVSTSEDKQSATNKQNTANKQRTPQTDGEERLCKTLIVVRGEVVDLKQRNYRLETRCLDLKSDRTAYEKRLQSCKCNLDPERRVERRYRNEIIRTQKKNSKSQQRSSDLRRR